MRLRNGKDSSAQVDGPVENNVATHSSTHLRKTNENQAGVKNGVSWTPPQQTLAATTTSLAVGASSTLRSDTKNGAAVSDAVKAVVENCGSTRAGLAATSKDIRPHDKNAVFLLKLGASVLVAMYFVVPAIVKLNPWIMSEVAFLHRIRVPFFTDLGKPSDVGMNGTLNIRIRTTDDLTLGAWHVLPESLQGRNISLEREFSDLLSNGEPIIIYLHGNAGTRATQHRVDLYKVLSKAGFHVVTIDYRGYGDSPGSPSEDGLVEDALAAFDWVKSRSGNAPVYFWGHSLGSGVATHAASKACQRGTLPSGVILEAPFLSMSEAAVSHPLSTPFRYMPYFTWVFVESLKYNNIYFSSDKHIKHITVPVLILHSEDDAIIPFEHGQKLYEAGRSSRTDDGSVKFVGFKAKYKYGHDNICLAPDLTRIVKEFMAGPHHS